MSVAIEQEAVTIVTSPGDLGVLAPDDLNVRQRACTVGKFQNAPNHRCAARIIFPGFGVAQIHEPVFGEIGMHGDIAQAALTAVVDIGNAVYRL